MALIILYLALDLSLSATAYNPEPRTKWEHSKINLIRFHEPDVFNYSVLLLSENENVLYVGARDAIFAVNSLNIAEKQHEVYWKSSEDQKSVCYIKGRNQETECFNYIRILQPLNETFLYVCGSNAFQPICDYLDLTLFELAGRDEDGQGRCPFDPMESYTSVMVDGELYSGTSIDSMKSQYTIFRKSKQNSLRTEPSKLWLNEPHFVAADVIRARQNSPNGDDDKVYFFFTEISLEFNYFGEVMVPRVARVCKGDQGGLWILQNKWTTFLKASLFCHIPGEKPIFNIVNDVFILKSPDLEDPLIYGVFTSEQSKTSVSAVCAYSVSSVEEVFAKGRFMKSSITELKEIKSEVYNGAIPEPRPGMCINNNGTEMDYTSSLNLPQDNLQFAKEHHLMYNQVIPIGKKPQLVKQDVIYTQIAVDSVKALDSNTYHVMFICTDEGILHKAIRSEHGMHIIEEIKLFPVSEPIQTLLLSSKENKRYIYAGSSSGVVQAPVAFCEKYPTCRDCVLARDPYCAWNPQELMCVNILQERRTEWALIQSMNGNASFCEDIE
ncbi:semaphorin-4D-like [Microcaecilia unicolor]|uniref:Semaphorin-4D-like n=1 Tax=Microcaecilia unicolor TaxID=1415580 RepID=A0A6P7XCE8_9AMPH|nr:semaphorin-4D-like [Microcaecilia unicolor]